MITAQAILDLYTTSRSRQTGTDLALLAVLILDPGISTMALSKRLGLTVAGVSYHLRDLRARGLITTTKKASPADKRHTLHHHTLSPAGRRHFHLPDA